MATSYPKPLPDQWTILLHPILNLTILTLLDADNTQRQIGFHSSTPPGTSERTVSALDQITETGLRASAQELIDTFYARTAQAQANSAAFSAAVPDQRSLLDRLRAETSCLVSLDIDDEALTIVLKFVAEGPATAILYALIASWPGSNTSEGPPAGVLQSRDDHGGLTVHLDQARAQQFLTWYRDQP
ncbi:hypothetical protein AB0D66_21990 [Streptomyces sp. NPDC048270]|uniref:hypothetical protein n=1 Tax=Streptomyces sp. NPDC048270 TaxID=3154615 RepID=UPI003403B96A